jgi:hypothetical protein
MRSYPLRSLATLPLEASSTMLDVRELAHPFDYQLEVLTEEGPEVRKVDLVETFNLVCGLRVRTMRRRVNEADNGRTYRVVTGTDAEGHSTLVIWRDMGDLDPKADRDFIEESMAGLQGAPFETILVNGDSAVPRATSLDPVFKQRMSEGET